MGAEVQGWETDPMRNLFPLSRSRIGDRLVRRSVIRSGPRPAYFARAMPPNIIIFEIFAEIEKGSKIKPV